jgi:DNA-binding response OmpR family regulator
MSQTTKKETILVVEGDRSFGNAVSSALKADGYSVSLANDSMEGLKNIYDVLPQLLILDLGSGADTYELLEKKHADVMLSKIPVLVLSTQGESINMRRVPAGSVVDFIVSLESNTVDVVDRVNKYFGHTIEKETKSDNTKSSKAKKILWVEDDKLIGSILDKKFDAAGITVVRALNGEEAFALLKEFMPDLIILDITLPGMDGFEILQKIHMDKKYKDTQTLILSNLSRPSDFEKAKILGSTKYMVKAASSLDQIVAEVQKLLV